MIASEPSTTEGLVSLAEIRAAAQRLQGFARHTPLIEAYDERLSSGAPLRLKCENLQRGGAFKLRGAYNFIAQLSQEDRSRGVVTYSSGNHGRAVALAARALDARATVVVPVDAPRVKVEGIRRLGAELLEEGTTSVERQRRAEEIAAARGAVIVPPFDHPDIIAGQGTAGLEIVEDWPQVERVIVPVGGGGLLSGVAAALDALVPEVRVYGVEPRGAAAMARSLEAGKPVSLDSVETIADGLKPVRPGDLTFAHARKLVDEIVTVDDELILRALAWCAEECRLLVEPSGAAGVAALIAGALPGRAAATAVILSGGNVDASDWSGWLRRYGGS